MTRLRHVQTLLVLMVVFWLPNTTHADHDIDWDDWYDGDVEVDLRIRGGKHPVVCAGEDLELSVRVNEDAYVLVYAIDPEGYVRLLYPRYWRVSGWLEAGDRLRLRAPAFADPVGRWRGLGGRSCGPVYIQAVASPVPFDWDAIGLVTRSERCDWRSGGGFLRVSNTGHPDFEFVLDVLSCGGLDPVYAVDTAYFHPACHARTYARPRVHLQFVLGWGNRCYRPYVQRPRWRDHDHRRHVRNARREERKHTPSQLVRHLIREERQELEDRESRKRRKKHEVRSPHASKKKEIQRRSQTRTEGVRGDQRRKTKNDAQDNDRVSRKRRSR